MLPLAHGTRRALPLSRPAGNITLQPSDFEALNTPILVDAPGETILIHSGAKAAAQPLPQPGVQARRPARPYVPLPIARLMLP